MLNNKVKYERQKMRNGLKKAFFLFLVSCILLLPQAFAQGNFAKANELYDQGNFKESVKYYRAAIDDDYERRYEPYAWFNLGNALVQLKRPNVAMVAYKRTVELLPDFVRAWALLGDLYFMADDIGMALAAYGRAVELGEDTDHIHFAMAECYLKARDYTNAERHYERTLRINPDRMDAWYGLADVYEKLGDYENAIKTLNNALQFTATAGADVHFTLSHFYIQMDSTRKALNSMENGLLMAPENVSARRFLAHMYLKAEEPWMALFILEDGLRYKQGKAELYVDIGQIYFGQKRYDEAFENYLNAWKLGSSQGRIGAENVGHIWFNAGDEAKAQELYKRIREKK